MGKIFMGSSAGAITIHDAAQKSTQALELINQFEFDSARKRMSVIIKDQQGNYKMYMKGADNIVKLRLSKSIQQPFMEASEHQLREFAKIGLRTLLIAMKVMSKQEVEDFKKTYNGLADDPQRQEKLTELANSIE